MNWRTKAARGARALRSKQRGFTLIEVAIASVVLVVGAVAVMQLVPAALQSNLNNRNQTTAAVAIQRLRDLMVNQALTATTLADPNGEFPCGTTATCSLGDSTKNDAVVGARLLANGEIDFTSDPVAGYSFLFTNPNDPTQAQYDVRWAVITSVRNIGALTNVVVAKRLVVGARRRGPTTPYTVTFVSWISR